MFKEYKSTLKNLREMQDQLWKDTMADFPGSVFPRGIDEWQKQTLENVNNLVGQAIGQSLELQREWMEQWSERAGDKKLKPELFSELSGEARDATQRWLDNQNQLWSQWLQVLGGAGGSGTQPGFELWEKSLQEYTQRQQALFDDWSKMTDFKKLSVNEATKLSNQIAKVMEKSIETQQRLWSHWLDDMSEFGNAGKSEEHVSEARPEKKKKKAVAKTRKGTDKSSQSDDDLKQISGIGPGLEKKLKDNGISALRQIAEWSDKDIANIEAEVIRFSGRIKREQWVEQARALIS